MKRTVPASSNLAIPLGLCLLALGACSGSGGASVGEAGAGGGDFTVVRTSPVNGATIFLNDPVSIDFTTPVDLDSATLNTMTFQALDQQGNPVPELVTGTFSLGNANGDADVGRRLQFVPRFATNNDYTDGGFKAGRTYLVRLVGGSANNNQVLRDVNGRALGQPITFQFSTRDGTQPAQLYRNPKSGGPTRTGMSVTTTSDLNDVPLGLFGAPPLEIRLDFDQALNPNTGNVPVAFDVNPLVRDINDRGRVYLEYDDPEYGLDTWIPADVDIERNDLTGSTLVLRPAGVLPNNATVRVIVEQTLEDISGENNLGNPAYDRVFGTFSTSQSYEQQWNGIAEDFTSSQDIDLAASFPESQAEVGAGYVRAGFAFEGNPTSLEYEPTANEVVLNTSFTQVVPKQGLPFTVSGGVFNFRNVTIPQGVTVRGTGPNPMVWLCSGKFTVAGTLTVRGGNGARVDTLNSANFAKAGHRAVHNAGYWQGRPYLGLGPSAHSFHPDGTRGINPRDTAAWMAAPTTSTEVERPTPYGAAVDYVISALRSTDGLDAEQLAARCGHRVDPGPLAALFHGKLLRQTPKGIALDDEGFYIADAVVRRVMDALVPLDQTPPKK